MRKILATIIFLISLSGCQTPSQPQKFEAEQCQTVLVIDPSGNVDSSASFCRCRNYEIGRDFIGSRGTVTRAPLGKCDQLIGYSVYDNTKLVNFLEYVRNEINSAEVSFEKGFTGEAEEPARAVETRREYGFGEADSSNH
jgi:hypothetical protein